MSRSYYHTPIMGITGRKSCKAWRSQENRRYRAYCKNLMRHEKYDDLPDYKGRFGNEWDSPRDGRFYFGKTKYRACILDEQHPFFPLTMERFKCMMYNSTYHFCYKAYEKDMGK